jgi:hypothetical protein
LDLYNEVTDKYHNDFKWIYGNQKKDFGPLKKRDIEKNNMFLAAKNYNYLLDAEYAKLSEEDVPNIERLYCDYFYGDADGGSFGLWQAVLFDFKENIFAYTWSRSIASINGLFDYGIYVSGDTYPLPANAFEDITGLLIKHKVINTRQNAKGTYDLYLELKDGRIIRHSCNSDFTNSLYSYERANF